MTLSLEQQLQDLAPALLHPAPPPSPPPNQGLVEEEEAQSFLSSGKHQQQSGCHHMPPCFSPSSLLPLTSPVTFPSVSPSPCCSSACCSLDVKIWEDFHLHGMPADGIQVSNPQCRRYPQLISTTHERIEAALPHTNSTASSSLVLEKDVPPFDERHLRCRSPSTCNALDLPAGLPDVAVCQLSRIGRAHSHAFLSLNSSFPVVQVRQTGSMNLTNEKAPVPSSDMVSKEPDAFAETLQTDLSEKIATSGNEADGREMGEGVQTDLSEKPATLGNEEDGREMIEGVQKMGAEEEEGTVARLDTFLSAKFLMQTPTELSFSPIPPFRTAGSVPFKWEEEPGRPKPCTDLAPFKPCPSLQLPPRLLYPSDLSRSNSARNRPAKPTSVPPGWSCASPTALGDLAKTRRQSKSLWQSFLPVNLSSSSQNGGDTPGSRTSRKKGDEDPWSPTSILSGPEVGRGTPSSSSSSFSANDVPSVSSLGSSEVQSRPMSLEDDCDWDPHSEEQKSGTEIVPSSFPYRDFGPSDQHPASYRLSKRAVDRVKNLLCRWRIAGRWRRSRRGRYRQESEMWAPTLATYFHSMELERGSSASMQQRLMDDEKSEVGATMEGSGPSGELQGGAEGGLEVEEGKREAAGEAVKQRGVGSSECGACSTEMRASGSEREGKGRRRRRWRLRRKSSGFFAAVWRAVSRSLRNAKSKRRRLPYENLHP